MTTTLKIPLTMAIMDGMEVSVGDSIFTIPINNILQEIEDLLVAVVHVGGGDALADGLGQHRLVVHAPASWATA